MVARQADSEPRHEPDSADRAITGAFALLRASMDDPDVVLSLPEDATVEFRDVVIDGHQFSLVAACGPDADAWMARPFRYVPVERPRLVERSAGATSVLEPDQIAAFMAKRTHGLSYDGVLDSLERMLTEAVDRALREPLAATDEQCGKKS
jgi:hypothetical protein